MKPANSAETPCCWKIFPHLRFEKGVSFSDDEHSAFSQSGLDARAHLGKEGWILDLYEAAGEHHVEAPLRPRARKPLFKVVVIRH